MPPTVTAVVVSFADPEATAAAVASLIDQSLAPAEILVIDNHPDGLALRELGSRCLPSYVKTIFPAANIGYARAANLAASRAQSEWLFFLNPDAVAAPDCLERLFEAVNGPDVSVVGAQVLLPDGRINAGDNPVHIAGFSWAGRYGCPREHGPAREVAAVSGAALLVRRDDFVGAGGLCPFFFMYVEDTDLAWRMRLTGRRVRYFPEAVVVHDYQFNKGPHKWFYLERNREWALLSNMQLRTLIVLGPLLFGAELMVLARAAREGWLVEKVRAWASLLCHLRGLIRWRRFVQTSRNVSDSTVLSLFTARFDTGLTDISLPSWVNRCLTSYRRGVLHLIASAEDADGRLSAQES